MDASRSSSASLCPGCGKAIDPLRAGHVAILDGGFRYFCGAECKSSYVDVTSKRMALDAWARRVQAIVEEKKITATVVPITRRQK